MLASWLMTPVVWAQSTRVHVRLQTLCEETNALGVSGTATSRPVSQLGPGPTEPSAPSLCDDADSSVLSAPIGADGSETWTLPRFAEAQLLDGLIGSPRSLARNAIETAMAAALLPAGSAHPVVAATNHESGREEAVLRVLSAWLQAWSARNAEAYLAHYSPEFTTGERGFSLVAWSQQRRQRLLKQTRISVRAQRAQVEFPDADTAQVRFLQDYRSSSLSETSHKVLALKRHGDSWRIVSERVEQIVVVAPVVN